MLSLGIDPGTAILGFGLVREHRDGSLEAVHFGVIRTKAETPMSGTFATNTSRAAESGRNVSAGPRRCRRIVLRAQRHHSDNCGSGTGRRSYDFARCGYNDSGV